MANKSAEESSKVCQSRFSSLAAVRDKLGKCVEEERLVGKSWNMKQVCCPLRMMQSPLWASHLEDVALLQVLSELSCFLPSVPVPLLS